MLRFDDQFPLHRKLAGMSDSGFRFHVEAIFWCARHLTDGWIAQDDLGVVSRYRKPDDLAQMCVEREAWHRVESGTIVPDCRECKDRYQGVLAGDGYVIHGYLDWQQPRSKVLQIREARKKAGKLGGQRSASVRASAKTAGKPAGQSTRGSKRQANDQAKPPPVAQPPNPPPSTKGGRDARAAPLGAPRVPEPDVPHPPTGNGTPTPPPAEVLAELRAKLATGRRRSITGGRQPGQALAELRALTDPPSDPVPNQEDPPADQPQHATQETP